MNEILLNSTAVVPATAGELQPQLVIKPVTSTKVIEIRRRVSIGLVKPEDEKYLTGEASDKDRIVKSVAYKIPNIKQPVEAKIDEEGYLSFTTENAAMATKEAIIRIISLVCTPIECVKSSINVRLHPVKGHIKAKNIGQVDMLYGDDIGLHISELYTVDDTQSQESENENQKEI
jgi:hypothetical protein